MLRRLPRLLRAAWSLAWQASPRTTVAVVALQVVGGGGQCGRADQRGRGLRRAAAGRADAGTGARRRTVAGSACGGRGRAWTARLGRRGGQRPPVAAGLRGGRDAAAGADHAGRFVHLRRSGLARRHGTGPRPGHLRRPAAGRPGDRARHQPDRAGRGGRGAGRTAPGAAAAARAGRSCRSPGPPVRSARLGYRRSCGSSPSGGGSGCSPTCSPRASRRPSCGRSPSADICWPRCGGCSPSPPPRRSGSSEPAGAHHPASARRSAGSPPA